MYRVMKPAYLKLKDGEFWSIRFDAHPGVLVSSMAEARRTYGCAVVLEWFGGVR